MLVVASIFRNAEGYVDRYFQQIDALRKETPVRLVLAEGDSTDRTLGMLEDRIGKHDTLLKVDHGGALYESVDRIERWAQIAYVCNTVLDHLLMADDDRLIYVEGDLRWSPDTMMRLLTDLDTVQAVAAMCFQPSTGEFYDVWGHVGMDGEQFTHEAPFHKALKNAKPGRLHPIQSAGSCIAVRGEVVNAGVRFANEDGIRGFCRTIRDHAVLYLDPEAEVYHA